MNEKFFDLKKEKQDRMINAALKVFGENGYKHASTDDIVAEAGISKGLLFHYFTNKLGLYTFLYDYSIRYMTLELSTWVKSDENDFFELLKLIETAKMQVLKNYPHMQQFIDSTRYEDVKEALLATEEKKDTLRQARENVMRRADLSKLKPGTDISKLGQLIDFVIKGLMTERFFDGSFQPEMLYKETEGYLEMMKKLTCNV